jgi:hypothetical protein
VREGTVEARVSYWDALNVIEQVVGKAERDDDDKARFSTDDIARLEGLAGRIRLLLNINWAPYKPLPTNGNGVWVSSPLIPNNVTVPETATSWGYCFIHAMTYTGTRCPKCAAQKPL